jgi:hypothetical protein
MKFKPLIIGAVIGAAVGWFMGAKAARGGNALGITGSFARPFQFGIDTGKGAKGG